MQVLREGFKSNEDSYLEQQGLVRVESLLQSIFPIRVDLKAQRDVCYQKRDKSSEVQHFISSSAIIGLAGWLKK